MNIIFAIAHILGAFIATQVIGFLCLKLWAWMAAKSQNSALNDASIALCIPVAQLDEPDNLSRVFKYSAERYSSDKFQNRLSDVFGWTQVVIGWAGALLQYGMIIVAVWYSITDDTSNAALAWLAVAITLITWFLSFVVLMMSVLLTGRHPGEPRETRKKLAELMRTHREPLDVPDY